MDTAHLYENFYSRVETQDLIDEVLSFLMTEGTPEPSTAAAGPPKAGTYTYEMIPTVPVNELGWGALFTPEGKKNAAPVDKTARTGLAQYLKSIGGKDLKGKLDSLNRFFSGATFPGPEGSPGTQLRRTISYLIFYKTMTEIITNFNAASAGFTFESFIAVLLDATHGQQIPATGPEGGGTIADIRVYKDGRPISLKLYKEGSLKVGGSYTQLIKDLTGPTPTMEYIAVTKVVSGEGPAATGHINFYSFQFTLTNVAQILALGKKTNSHLLTVPAIFANVEELKKMQGQGDLDSHLHMPAKGSVETAPLVKAFYENVMAGVQQSEHLSDEAVRAIDAGLKPLLVGEASLPATTDLLQATGIGALGANERREAKAILSAALAAYREGYSVAKKAGEPRKQAFERRAYLSPEDSLTVLRDLAEAKEEDLLRLALKNTQGMTGKLTETQFELSQSQLKTLVPEFGEGNKSVFPYGTYELGSLQLGVKSVQAVLDKSVNQFNESVFQIFSDLKALSTSLNGYVASGLRKTKLATVAKEKATAIASGAEKIEADGDGGDSPDDGYSSAMGE
jgi:hypothetical protein